MVEGKNLVAGVWTAGHGAFFESTDSVTHEVLWRGHEASAEDVDQAVQAAREAVPGWGNLGAEARFGIIKKFKSELESHREKIVAAIASETGKPCWEAATEVGAMIGKVDLSWEAFQKRSGQTVVSQTDGLAQIRYKPHGVVAVFGPYNFPGHLANGHIVPALLAGNTVIFKQSELTPLVGELTVKLWEQAGLPAGVLNLVQGGKVTGVALAKHPGLDGLFFTGSSQTGIALHRQFADHPEKILALEMGGNNPLVVLNVKDRLAAAYTTIQSAYLTSGQRCTCARRLIVPTGSAGDAFLNELVSLIPKISVGHHSARPEPFMGPLITKEAADRVVAAYGDLVQRGGKVLVPLTRLKPDTGLVSPGLLDVTGITARDDCEIFGPLLQVIRVADFDEAIEEANRTAYGLSAGLLSDSHADFEKFYTHIRAGIVNWNRQTTGASGSAPFGGMGLSGNHRPSAYFAADYCSYPVATTEAGELKMPAKLLPGITL